LEEYYFVNLDVHPVENFHVLGATIFLEKLQFPGRYPTFMDKRA
jgi:hypothetical protein